MYGDTVGFDLLTVVEPPVLAVDGAAGVLRSMYVAAFANFSLDGAGICAAPGANLAVTSPSFSNDVNNLMLSSNA